MSYQTGIKDWRISKETSLSLLVRHRDTDDDSKSPFVKEKRVEIVTQPPTSTYFAKLSTT